jgi:uncharacterized protein (TIGR00369 family)
MEVLLDDRCFVCGPTNPLGLKARFIVDRDRQSAHCAIRIPADYQGWWGLVHGGILAALVDEAGVYACRASGEHFVTAELTVKYKIPVPVDVDLLITAEVVGRKRRIYSVVARIERDGQVLVESTGKIVELADSP